MYRLYQPVALALLVMTTAACARIATSTHESSAAASAPDYPIRLLVVTGGHAYEEEPFEEMWRSMDEFHLSRYTFTDHAELFDNIDGWQYDVVVFYSMTQEMTEERWDNFMRLTEWGVGIIPLHHGTLSWSFWPRKNEIIGVDFPIPEQPFGYHIGEEVEYQITDPTHPITQGMQDFTLIDETYTNFYGDGEPDSHVIISTDHDPSDPELVWVRKRNNSRIVSIQGGHDGRVFNDENYRDLLKRSIRWAAGRTPYEAGSDDVAEFAIYRDRYETQVALEGFIAFEPGDSRGWQVTIERLLDEYANDPEHLQPLTEGLVGIAQFTGASREARIRALRMLATYADEADLEAVAALLRDPDADLAAGAVFALEDSPRDAFANGLLAEALVDVETATREEILMALGRERFSPAVDSISAYIGTASHAAAMDALASIGTREALGVLRQAFQAGRADADSAILNLANETTEVPVRIEAIEFLLSNDVAPVVRADATFLSMVYGMAEGEILAGALTSDDSLMVDAGLRFLYEPSVKPDWTVGAVLPLVPSLDPEVRARTLRGLASYESALVADAAVAYLADDDDALRAAALDAIASAGTAETAQAILVAAAMSKPGRYEYYTDAMTVVPDLAADSVFLAAAQSAGRDAMPALIDVLRRRHAVETAGDLIAFFDVEDRDVRRATAEALGAIADERALPALLDVLVTTDDSGVRRAVARAVKDSAQRIEDKALVLGEVTARFDNAGGDAARAMTETVGVLRTPEARVFLEGLLASEDTDTVLDAIRALTSWTNTEPVEALLATAGSTDDIRVHTLAMRAVLAIADRVAIAQPKVALGVLASANPLVDSTGLKKQLISVAGKVELGESLDILALYAGDSDVQAEAVQAITSLAEPLASDYPEQVVGALRAIAESGVDEELRRRMTAEIEHLEDFRARLIANWGFAEGPEGWDPWSATNMETGEGVLHLESRGMNPFIGTAFSHEPGPMLFQVRMRTRDDLGGVRVQWQTTEDPWGPDSPTAYFTTPPADGEWHDLEVLIEPRAPLQGLKLDYTMTSGTVAIDYIRLMRPE